MGKVASWITLSILYLYLLQCATIKRLKFEQGGTNLKIKSRPLEVTFLLVVFALLLSSCIDLGNVEKVKIQYPCRGRKRFQRGISFSPSYYQRRR